MYLMKAGDIFAFKIATDEYLSGRVLLDIERQCVVPRRLPADSPLGFYGTTLLVEVHGTPMDKPGVGDGKVLISSVFFPAGMFARGTMPVVGHRPIDPIDVDFPAGTILHGSDPHLAWGELRLPIPMEGAEYERVELSVPIRMQGLEQLALVALGREDEVDRKRYRKLDMLQLSRTDLRYSNQGPDLFLRAGLPSNPSYYKEALKRGFDTKRFYEQDPLVPISVCPYCWSVRTPNPICWACGEDTSRDASIETSSDEMSTMKRKSCGNCGTSVPYLAHRCPKCRSKLS